MNPQVQTGSSTSAAPPVMTGVRDLVSLLHLSREGAQELKLSSMKEDADKHVHDERFPKKARPQK